MSAPPPQPIFVLGAHRGGTTLLQRLLNSYDDVLVWGEHAGVLEDVAAAFWRGLEEPNLFRHARPLADVLADSDPLGTWQAWLGWLDRPAWIAAFRRIVETLLVPEGLPGKRFWGFKEIRYGARGGDRTIDFLHTLYPDALFAFIVRNPFNAVASSGRAPGGARGLAGVQRAADLWRRRYRTYRAWHAAGSVRSFWIRYEDLCEAGGEVHALLAAMGRTFGDRQRAVLAAEGGRGSSFRDGDVNARWRTLGAGRLALVNAACGALARELGYTAPPLPPGWRLLGPVLLRILRLGAACAEALGTRRQPAPGERK